MRLLRHQLHVTYTDRCIKTPEPPHTEYALQQYQIQGSVGASAVITAAPAKEWNATRTRFASDTSQGCNYQAHFWESATRRQQKIMRCSRKCWSSVVGLAAFN